MYTVKEYYRAENLDDAYSALLKNRNNRIIGGGMWLHLGRGSIGTLVDICDPMLSEIKHTDDEVSIGAMTTLREIETDKELKRLFSGVLPSSLSSIVGIQLRNTATIGGTVWGRYGFSDPLCALLSLSTEVETYLHGRISLEEFIKMPYEKDILTFVHIRKDGRRAAFVSMRASSTDFPILNLSLSHINGSDFRVAVGARPYKAARCTAAEEQLNRGDVEGAADAVKALNYGTNMRAGAEYRRDMSAVLLSRALDMAEVKR